MNPWREDAESSGQASDRENCRNGLLNPCHEIAESSGQASDRANCRNGLMNPWREDAESSGQASDRESCRNGLLNPYHEIAESSGQVQARAKTTATKPCGHMRGSTKLDIHDDLVRICEQIYLYRCKVTQCCVGADTTVNFHPNSICECKGHPVLL